MFKKNKSKSEGRLAGQWFNLRLTVGRRLNMTFVAILFFLVLIAVTSYVYFNLINDKFTKLADDTIEEIQILGDINVSSESFLSETREYLLFGEASTLEELKESAEELDQVLGTFATAGEEVEVGEEAEIEAALVDEINTSWEAMQTSSATLISLYEQGEDKEQLEQVGEALEEAEQSMSNALEEFQEFLDEEIVEVTGDVNNTVRQIQMIMIFVPIGALLLTIGLGFLLSRSIVAPIHDLTKTARDIEIGNLVQEAKVARNDEIGELANSFNLMITRLRESMHSLDRRASDLATVAEVSMAASTVLEAEKLLQQVVDLAKERFGLYHAHIYLLNEAGDMLVLVSGSGEPGRQMVVKGHAIPFDREQSLVARAARERKGVTVNDVTQAPDFLPNPLLPETRSELAVPMMVGEQVIGVFDVQSEIAGRFTDSDIAVQTTLASQVASAIQNARSYTEVQRSQALLSEALKIAKLANWEYDFEKDLFTFNDDFYTIFRTTVEKVGGYKISSADYARIFVHPDDASLVGSEIQRVLDAKDRLFRTQLEHRIIFSDGEVGYISVNINVERDENGKITRWYGANQDITERKRLQDLTAQRARQQEAINTITQRIQAATTIEDAMQVAARELGHALGKRQTLVALEPSALAGENRTTVAE
jgi:PAS domain S-box-containing protein